MRGLHSRAVGCATKASGHHSHPICWRKAQSQCGNAHDQIGQHHDRLPPNLVCTLTSTASAFAWSPPDSRITFSTGLSDFGCLIERTYGYGIGRQTPQRAVCASCNRCKNIWQKQPNEYFARRSSIQASSKGFLSPCAAKGPCCKRKLQQNQYAIITSEALE